MPLETVSYTHLDVYKRQILFAPSDYAEGFIPFNITCGTLLKYQILLAFKMCIRDRSPSLLPGRISPPACGHPPSGMVLLPRTSGL